MFSGVLGAVAAGAALGGLAAAATRRNKRAAEDVTNPLIGEQFLFDSLAAVDKGGHEDKILLDH